MTAQRAGGEGDQSPAQSPAFHFRNSGTSLSGRRTREFDEDYSLRGKVYRLVSSHVFEIIMSFVIALNVVFMVVETNNSAGCVVQDIPDTDCQALWIVITNIVFLLAYTVESALRLYAERLDFFKSGWNHLDAFIIVCGWIDLVFSFTLGSLPGPSASLLRVFRIMRLVRIVRILEVFPELYALVKGFIGAMRSMFWGFVMILVFLIIFSIISVEVLNPINLNLKHDSDYCRDAFSSIQNCMTLFMQTLVAGDSWGHCAIPLIQHSTVALILMVVTLVCIQLGVTNLILAVIVDRANKVHEADVENKTKMRHQSQKRAAGKLRVALASIDTDCSGTISRDELEQGFTTNPSLQNLLNSVDIERSDIEGFFALLDECNEGELAYDRLIDVILSASLDDVRKQVMMLRLQSSQIARTLVKAADVGTFERRPRRAEGELSLTSLHQTLRERLIALEQDVLETIDSWASQIKIPRLELDDVSPVLDERDFAKAGCNGHDKPLTSSLQSLNELGDAPIQNPDDRFEDPDDRPGKAGLSL